MATPRVITRTEAQAWKELLNRDGTIRDDIVKTGESDPGTAKETILTALNKYIPATVIILYTLIDVIFRTMAPPPVFLWLVFFVIMLAGAGWLTYRITKETLLPDSVRKDQQVHDLVRKLDSIINRQRLKQSFVAVIAFAGYVLAIGGPFAFINKCEGNLSCQISFMSTYVWQPYYGDLALVLATLAVAIILGKDILAE